MGRCKRLNSLNTSCFPKNGGQLNGEDTEDAEEGVD